MGFQTVRPYLSRFALGFALGLPVAVTFVENVGSLKGVHGISMQVSKPSRTVLLTGIKLNPHTSYIQFGDKISLLSFVTSTTKIHPLKRKSPLAISLDLSIIVALFFSVLNSLHAKGCTFP